MLAGTLLSYLWLVSTPLGALGVLLLSVAIFAGVVRWARRPSKHGDRVPSALAAATLTILLVVGYSLAVSLGWWTGAYFATPLALQVVPLAALSIVAWLVWLRGYEWLVAHRQHPLMTSALMAVVAIPLALLLDQLDIGGGLIVVARDGDLWRDGLTLAIVAWLPLLLFEQVRHALRRDVLP